MENENKNVNLKSDDLKNLNVLRTYTSDMADMVRTNEASVIKIALAEKNKREQEELIKKGFLFDSNNYSEFHAILNNDDYFIYIVNLKHSTVPYGIIHAKLSQNKKVLLISNKNDIITNTEFIDYRVSKIGKFYKYELSLKKVE